MFLINSQIPGIQWVLIRCNQWMLHWISWTTNPKSADLESMNTWNRASNMHHQSQPLSRSYRSFLPTSLTSVTLIAFECYSRRPDADSVRSSSFYQVDVCSSSFLNNSHEWLFPSNVLHLVMTTFRRTIVVRKRMNSLYVLNEVVNLEIVTIQIN
jgi:hypothetical protein